MTKVLAVLFVAFSADALAQSSPIELRGRGEHVLTKSDTQDSARRLALVEARAAALAEAVTRLRSRDEVKALTVAPSMLEPYTWILLEMEEQPAQAVTGRVRAEVRARIDPVVAARRIAGLHKDQDVTREIGEAWKNAQQARAALAETQRRRATTGDAEAAALVQEQLRLAVTLEATHLAARAAAAMARTVPATVGGRVAVPDGLARAEVLVARALAMLPDSPDALSVQGDLFIEAEQAGPAEDAFRRALKNRPGSSLLRTKLAEVLRLQGRFDEALAELEEVLRSDASFARAHSDRGMVLRAQQKLPESIDAYREALRLDPDSVDAHNGLAVTLANSKRMEEAVAEFREIVRIDPDSTIGYYNLAYALAELDRDVESAAALREVIRIYPDHYNARFNLAELFRLEGKFDESLTQFREYVRLAPDTPQNRRNIIRANGFIEKFSEPEP